jgi:hypothetical protein
MLAHVNDNIAEITNIVGRLQNQQNTMSAQLENIKNRIVCLEQTATKIHGFENESITQKMIRHIRMNSAPEIN